MITYKIKKTEGRATSILRSDGWEIPLVKDNTDYIAYLAWLEAGNTPEAAE